MGIPRFGYGCYRVENKNKQHFESLYKAVTNGITLIETSANYSNGGSEILAGDVLTELLLTDKIKREEITIITKGGYIQGQNFTLVQKKKEQGKSFPAVVEFEKNLWHCIHPDFLEDQIERQLSRLNQIPEEGGYIDVYLLHNPEYYLKSAKKNQEHYSTAKEEYYKRIKKAFEFLEEKVAKGVIKNYGISSNTFPLQSNKYDFTSLSKIYETANDISASNHFKYIEFPFNFIEFEAQEEKNQDGNSSTLLKYSENKKINTLANRPLNAVSTKGLLRLTEFARGEFSEAQFNELTDTALVHEKEICDILIPMNIADEESIKKLKNLSSFARTIKSKYKSFGSIEYLSDISENYFTPRLKYLRDFTEDNFDEDSLPKLRNYLSIINELIERMKIYYGNKTEKRSDFLNRIIDEHTDEIYHRLTLAQKTLLILSSVEGVSCVLCGMRKVKYVDEVTELLKFEKIKNAEEIIRKINSELSKYGITSINL